MITLLMTMMLEVPLQAEAWRAVNDGVMGGVSAGELVQSGDHLRFQGRLSLENNGGFASVRRAVSRVPADARAVRLRVRGDGRRYQFRLRHGDRFDGVAWRAGFATTTQWQSVELPLAEFEPVFRGRRVPDAGPVRPAQIGQIGFLLADGQAGSFELDIAAIEFVAAAADQ